MDSISVIVPSYNEEKTVKLFYDEMKRIMKKMNEIDFEIIFVDDGLQIPIKRGTCSAPTVRSVQFKRCGAPSL